MEWRWFWPFLLCGDRRLRILSFSGRSKCVMSVLDEPGGRLSGRWTGKPPQQSTGIFTSRALCLTQPPPRCDGYLQSPRPSSSRGAGPEIPVVKIQPPPPSATGNRRASVRTDPRGLLCWTARPPPAICPVPYTRKPWRTSAQHVLGGYFPVHPRTVQVRRGDGPQIMVYGSNVRPPARKSAELSVRTEHAGASCLWTASRLSKDRLLLHTYDWRHHVTMSLDGYFPVTQNLQVRAGMDPKLM